MKRGIVLGLCLLSSLLSLTVQAQDTLYVYGGPSTLEGKFEDVAGLPDRQGWQGVDLTALPANRWHIDNFHCANLDPTTPDNHAWWCGEVYVSCGLNDPPEGYGNGYEEYLDWYGVVPDTTVSVTVTVEAMLNYDNEPGYDYLYLKLQWGTGWLEQQDYNGQADSVVVVETFSLDPENYVPHPDSGEPSVHLRWEFTSDSGWSDEDCDWPTAGAAQIDLIKVFFDQGGGPVQIGETETCEAGDPQQWEAIPRPGVGDFSKVWPLLDDIDPDPAAQNDTPQFAFIDDGIVVPGTGGTPCITWCYGPDGWVVPNQHDLGECLTNEIWSPPIDLPETEYDMVVATWDEYQHNDLTYYCQSMLWLWHVRSTADPTGQDGWSAWEDRDFVYYGGPRYFRRTENITEFLVPDACYVQLALGTWEAEIWGIGSGLGDGVDHDFRFQNVLGRGVVAVEFGLLWYDIFNEFQDGTEEIVVRDLAPGETTRYTSQSFPPAPSSFYTGLIYVRKVRFLDGEIWEAVPEDLDANIQSSKRSLAAWQKDEGRGRTPPRNTVGPCRVPFPCSHFPRNP